MDYFFVLLSVTLLDSVFCTKETITGTVGRDCVLPCRCSARKTVNTVEWILQEQRRDLLLYRRGTLQYSLSDRIQFQPLGNDLNLTLRDVQTQDQGTYMCLVHYEDGEWVQQLLWLSVQNETTVQTDAPDTEINEERIRTRLLARVVFGVFGFFALILLTIILIRKKQISEQYSDSQTRKKTGECVPVVPESEQLTPFTV